MSLLIGIAIAALGYLTAFAYFAKPEEFWLKRLRRSPKRAVSHRALIFRAYVGIGVVHTGIQAVGFFMAARAHSDPSGWVWAGVALAACPIIGTMSYAFFRVDRYRRISADERASGDWGDGAFVQRAPFGDELKTHWAKRVDRVARIVVAILAALAIALVIVCGVVAG